MHHVSVGPLKEQSEKGSFLKDPSGELQLVFARLLSIVGDDPELKEILAIFSGFASQMPCARCTVPHEHMHHMGEVFPLRTCSSQDCILQLLSQATSAAEKRAVSKQFSTHEVLPGLRGFAGEKTEAGNLYQLLGYDSLHIDLLGIWLDLMNAVKPFALASNDGQAAALIRKINENLLRMPRYICHAQICVLVRLLWMSFMAVQFQL